MNILICILSLWVFFKNISFSIYEYKVNQNIVGSVSVAVFSAVCLVFVNVVLFLT